MNDSVPAVVSVPVFLLTVPFLVLYVSWGARVTNRKRINRAQCMWLIGLGLCFVAIAVVLLLNLGQADGNLIGWLFSWGCGHGFPAAIVLRNCIALAKLMRKAGQAKDVIS